MCLHKYLAMTKISTIRVTAMEVTLKAKVVGVLTTNTVIICRIIQAYFLQQLVVVVLEPGWWAGEGSGSAGVPGRG